MQTGRHAIGREFLPCLFVAATLQLAGPIGHPVLAADAATETRAIIQQVLALIKTSNLGEAETLAKKGLQLCDDAGTVKVFCASQFGESLGDIAFAQAKYSAALEYYQQALNVREAGLESGHLLISRSLLRIGRVYLIQQRMAEAETFVQRAVTGFEKLVPVNLELGTSLGYLRKIYLDTNRVDEATVAARRELEVYRAIGGSDGQAVSSAKLGLSTILSRRAGISLRKNDYPDAEQILIEAIKLIDPPPTGRENLFALLQAQLGSVYERQRRYAEAEPFMLRALEYRSKITTPGDSEMPIMLSNLAMLYSNLGRPAETIPYAVRTVSWFDENKQEKPTLGYVLLHLGRAQRQLGHLSDAEAALLRARDVLDRVLPEGDPWRLTVRTDIGSLWMDQERFGEAAQIFQSALDIEPKLARPAIGWRPSVLASLGMVYREQARYAEAERLLSDAVNLEEAGGDERLPFLRQRLIELASILRRENRYPEAEAALLHALAAQPTKLDRATALNSLGVIYTSTDRYERAETVLEEALEIRTKELPANSFLAAETLGNLATVDSSKGRYADAELKLRHVLEVVEASGQSHSSNAALYSGLLSQALVSEGKLDEADDLIRRSLDLYRQRLGSEHPRFAGSLKTLASIEALRGRDRDAEEHYRQALAIDEKKIGPQSPAVASDLTRLVPLLKRAGRRQDAKAAIDRALTINIAQFGADSPMTVGAILDSANMAYEEGRYVAAGQLARRARQIQERTFGPEHQVLAGSWIFAARLDIAQDKLDDAATDVDRAAIIIAKAFPPDHPSNIDVLEGNAEVAQARGKPADAEQYAHEALVIAEKLFGPDHPARRAAVNRLVGELWAQGKFAAAEKLRRDELAKVELVRGPDHPSTAVAVRGIANVLGSSGRQGEAIALYRRALSIDEQSFGRQSDQVGWDLCALGSLLRKVRQFEDARNEISHAREAWESQGHFLAANSSLEQLALLAFDQGSPAEGVVFVERMLNVTEQAFGADSPALAAILAQLGRLYVVAGRTDAAEKVLLRINDLIGENPPEQAPGYLNVLQLQGQLSAEKGDVARAENLFLRAIAVATKYGSSQAAAVGTSSFNLAAVYLAAGRYQDAVKNYARALEILKRESGDRAPIVGYTLLGAAQAYAGIGDAAASKALLAMAIEILGPAIAAQRPQPRWL